MVYKPEKTPKFWANIVTASVDVGHWTCPEVDIFADCTRLQHEPCEKIEIEKMIELCVDAEKKKKKVSPHIVGCYVVHVR
jgi:hypothetical protein